MAPLAKASVVLFLAAEVLIFATIGPDALFLAAAWAVVAAVVGAVARFVHGAVARVSLAAMLLAACVLFATELGLFFAPSAALLLGAAVSDQRQHRLLHGGG